MLVNTRLHSLIASLALWLSISVAHAQGTAIAYYKDNSFSRPVSQNWAVFELRKTTNEDGVTHLRAIHLKSGCTYRDEYYKDKKPVGKWLSFGEDCTLRQERDFDQLAFAGFQPEGPIGCAMEGYEAAEYPGGPGALRSFFSSGLDYPIEAAEAGTEGVVWIQLRISAKGEIREQYVVQSDNPYLAYEAWQLCKAMPAWQPAKCNGVAVASYRAVPLRFHLH